MHICTGWFYLDRQLKHQKSNNSFCTVRGFYYSSLLSTAEFTSQLSSFECNMKRESWHLVSLSQYWKITTIHNYAHFPSFKTVPQLPIPHFSLVSWKIHLCKYSVCWLSVIVSGPGCLLRLHYLCTMPRSSPFLPRGSNLLPIEAGSSDFWEKSQQTWIFSCCVP